MRVVRDRRRPRWPRVWPAGGPEHAHVSGVEHSAGGGLERLHARLEPVGAHDPGEVRGTRWS